MYSDIGTLFGELMKVIDRVNVTTEHDVSMAYDGEENLLTVWIVPRLEGVVLRSSHFYLCNEAQITPTLLTDLADRLSDVYVLLCDVLAQELRARDAEEQARLGGAEPWETW